MKSAFWFFLFFFILCFQLEAQESWSLDQCIERAWEQSLLIQQSQFGIDNAKLDIEQSTHARYPSLSGQSGFNVNFGRTIDPTTNSFNTNTFVANNFGLNSGVLLYGGGRIKNSLKQSEINLEAAEKDLLQTQNDIALQVANLYLNVLFAEENIKAAQVSLDQTQTQLNQTEKLINAGVRPRNESLDIEAQIARDEQAVIEAENSKLLGLVQLKQILRLEADYDLQVTSPEGINPETDPELLSFQEIYDIALQSQPGIKSAILREESARVGIDIAKAQLYPSLSLGASIGTAYSNRGFRINGTRNELFDQTVILNGNEFNLQFNQEIPNTEDATYFQQFSDNLSYGFGFILQVPIYNNRLGRIGVERAKINLANSSVGSSQLKERIMMDIQQALADAKAAKRSMQAAEKSLNAFNASFENANKRYGSGALTSFELNNIKAQRDNAQTNLIVSKYNYLFRILILEFYMGKPFSI